MKPKFINIYTKTIANVFIGLAIASNSMSAKDSRPVSMSKPVTTENKAHYVTNRAPLLPSHFIKLPVGSIQPEGWLRQYLELQRDGLTGHLGEISAWLEKKNNAWLTAGGDHGWEEVPYWLKGYGNLAYILGDEKMIAETKTWIEGALASKQKDGYFGPINERGGKRELWAHMIMLWCLQSYYEYTQDERVIELMTDYCHWQLKVPDDKFLKDYWENSRGGDNMLSVIWLYNRTGDKELLKLIEKLHRNTANWTNRAALPNWHNVNIAQGFREPATYYLLTGDSLHLQASYDVHEFIRRTYGQVPGGMFGADENARIGYIDPRQGVETCGMVEEMASDEIMLRITGDARWADQCEEVAFNTYPAATMPDFRALRYITSPNHIISDSKNHHPSIDNSGPFLSMNPFSSRCCQHNHAQGWPYYAEHLMMATPDGGAAALLYAACQTKIKVGDGQEIMIKEKTEYPFEETISFQIETSREVDFPLYLRIPSWAEEAKVCINGKKADVKAIPGQYVQIARKWKQGDQVTLTLPMSLQIKHWNVNQNSASVYYGPLGFSLKIQERYEKKDSRSTAIHDSQWQQNADAEAWPTYEIYADSPWNYALTLDPKKPLKNFKVVKKEYDRKRLPFIQNNVPLEIQTFGQRIPSWKTDLTGVCEVLPQENAKKGAVEKITLIPMGAARLRVSAFPVSYLK